MKEKIVVVCPGRGTYTASELGYLKMLRQTGTERARALIDVADEFRSQQGLSTLTELDAAARYSGALHAGSAHAPLLISVCALADFMCIHPAKAEVVAVVGNSMGWYIALAAAGALSPRAACRLISTMGNLTAGGSASDAGRRDLGGQVIYPCVDEEWRLDPAKVDVLSRVMNEVLREDSAAKVFRSIRLGGFEVLAGNEPGVKALMAKLPPLDSGRYPMKLINHSAFHTPLMDFASEQGFAALGTELFGVPEVPLVDGEGRIWQPYSTNVEELRSYTLGRQVTSTYDFTSSVKVALREFAPTRLVLLGPGSNLGGALGQILVDMRWKGICSKSDFMTLQGQHDGAGAFLLSMGRTEGSARARSFLV